MNCSWCNASIQNEDISVYVGKWDYLHTRWQVSSEFVCSRLCGDALHANNESYVAQVEYELKHQSEIAKEYNMILE